MVWSVYKRMKSFGIIYLTGTIEYVKVILAWKENIPMDLLLPSVVDFGIDFFTYKE